jgi:hypothetical protein
VFYGICATEADEPGSEESEAIDPKEVPGTVIA